MSIQEYHRNTCRLCGEQALQSAMYLKPTPLEDDFLPANKADPLRQRFPLEIVLCKSCGHSQLSHVIAAESIYDHYIYQSNTSPGLIKHFEETCDHLIKVIDLKKGNSVVDLGCNDGALLEIYRQKGMQIVGVEPSPVAEVVKKKGIPTYHTYFNQESARDIVQAQGPASLVTANNVFANVDDLDSFVEAVKTILAADGVFVIETGYWKLLVQNGVFDYIYHEHLSYFSIKPLRQFFAKHDMQIYDAECTEMKGGSARIFVQLQGGTRKVSDRITRLIQEEKEFGLFDSAIYADFSNKLEKAKLACHTLLDSLNVSKDKIAGYGASPSVTTLLHLFDLGDRISFLVDDNTIKHNTVSPGYHLPVYPSSTINEREVEYMLILPWRFSKNIVAKNETFLKKGGSFVELYPESTVISYEKVMQ